MKELAERFIGKDCLIYTVMSDSTMVKGTVTEVTDAGIVVNAGKNIEVVNLEYVVRIQEWPLNSKGKKKTIFG